MEPSTLSRSFPPCIEEEATPVRRHLVHMVVVQSPYNYNHIVFPPCKGRNG